MWHTHYTNVVKRGHGCFRVWLILKSDTIKFKNGFYRINKVFIDCHGVGKDNSKDPGTIDKMEDDYKNPLLWYPRYHIHDISLTKLGIPNLANGQIKPRFTQISFNWVIILRKLAIQRMMLLDCCLNTFIGLMFTDFYSDWFRVLASQWFDTSFGTDQSGCTCKPLTGLSAYWEGNNGTRYYHISDLWSTRLLRWPLGHTEKAVACP